MTTADSADMEVDLALVDADQGSPPKEGASKSKSPSRPCQRGRSKRRGENAAGKAKARAAREKKPKKSGRNVEAGESMTCPVPCFCLFYFGWEGCGFLEIGAGTFWEKCSGCPPRAVIV